MSATDADERRERLRREAEALDQEDGVPGPEGQEALPVPQEA
jgi:hypothetical protein